ncbi:Hypothetical protein GLP15_1567 [Giardia lamblia P15]|uniref:P21-C-terminal region-binding protein n=1 Tax=Giardia intestinalis (strain P15) TaxID=658858 RepID=E1EXI3_GIAIA|nr:Hypothetical protein GLP15_1567 [Giardia lamblia P15]
MNLQDDQSEELFMPEEEFSDIQLNLEFADLSEDFRSEIETLASAFWTQTPYSELAFELAKIVSAQPEVGTVACGDDSTVLGYHSIVNFGQYLHVSAIESLFDLLLNALEEYKTILPPAKLFWQRLKAGTVCLGFLTTGRYTNLPMNAIAAFYQVVKDDIEWASGAKYNSSTPSHLFKFTHILYVTKAVLKDTEPSANQINGFTTNPLNRLKKRSLARPEDTTIIECSLFTLLIPASLGSFTCWVISVLDLGGYFRVSKALADEDFD